MAEGWGRRSAGAFAGLVLAGAVTMSGCDDAGAPTSTTSVPPTATASPSETPTTSVTPSPSESSSIPAAARKNTPEGAEAFVRYFFEQYNEAWTKPQVGLISSLSDPMCEFCAKAEDTSVTLSDRGDRYVQSPVSVRGTKWLAGAPEPEAYVFVDLLQNASDVVAKDGSVVHSDAMEPIPSNVAIAWGPGGWRVVAVEEA